LASRARPCAARTRLFGFSATPNGALRAPPAHCSFAASYSTPKNIYNLSNLSRPRPGLLSFQWTTEAMKYEVPSPTPPIAAVLILPAIFLGSNYVAMRPYALNFFVFFAVFGSFSCYSLLFLLSFSLSSYSSLLISSYSSLLRLLILPFFDPFLRPYVLPIFVLFFFINIMSPAPPIAASLIHTALIMIYSENPTKCPSLGKNPPKYTTACIVKQSNCRWHCEYTCFSI
jgi:hypothetical protein